MEIKNRRLFFAYALPCLENMIKKGKISKRKAELMISKYKAGSTLDGCENIFKTAMFYLEKTAKKMNRSSIDEEVIRKYFQECHNKTLKKEKFLEKCKIKFGKVIKVDKNYVVVKADGKSEKVKTFVDDLKLGDDVVLHWNYVVDRVNKKKILVFGNILVEKDNIALKIVKKLEKEVPNIEFKEFDTTENLEKEGKRIVIMDVVKGLKKVEVIDDIKKIERNKIYSLHDFDLSYELGLLKKLKMIENFKIIGIPPHLEEKEIVRQVKEILFNPSYL